MFLSFVVVVVRSLQTDEKSLPLRPGRFLQTLNGRIESPFLELFELRFDCSRSEFLELSVPSHCEEVIPRLNKDRIVKREFGITLPPCIPLFIFYLILILIL